MEGRRLYLGLLCLALLLGGLGHRGLNRRRRRLRAIAVIRAMNLLTVHVCCMDC